MIKRLAARGTAFLVCSVSFWTLWPPSERGGAKHQARPVWNKHRIIDIHGHIGTFKGYDLSTETLLKNIERYGIELVLISNIDGAELKETRNLHDIAANNATSEAIKRYPEKLRGLVWARPKDGSPSHLEQFLNDSSLVSPNSRVFVGLKLHPMMNHFPADDPRVDPYLNLCDKFDIPAVFHCDKRGTNGDPEKIYATARRHPKVRVILYHMVFFGPHGDAIDVVKESMTKGDAQLYLETAQAKPEDIVRAVKTLGSERVLFGTDATYYGKEHYTKYESMVRQLKAELSPRDFANVMRENAKGLFKLE
ncbi:MAG: amidohydrolase family protein [Ignavibacteriales bacterium]|nr:amidohydrolase family protein [Ignavibacteriales bacterium]